MRKAYSELPSVSELAKILKREAKRDIPNGRQLSHYASFDPFVRLLKTIGYPKQHLELDISWQEILVQSEEIIRDLPTLILKQDPEKIKTDAREAYRYLAEEDQPQKADLILAFGAKTSSRAEKAIDLFKQGFAPKIMFSGWGPTFVNEIEESEAVKYKKLALAVGIPEEAIIIETEAITLPDNIRRSLNLLDNLKIPYRSVILVNSPYAQRRGAGYFQKYSPVGTVLYRVNCETKGNIRENTWFRNEEGIKYIVNEYLKIWMSSATNTI